MHPIEQGLVNKLNEQDGLYALFLRGIQNNNIIFVYTHNIKTNLKGLFEYIYTPNLNNKSHTKKDTLLVL